MNNEQSTLHITHKDREGMGGDGIVVCDSDVTVIDRSGGEKGGRAARAPTTTLG